MITLGKKQGLAAYRKASGFVLDQTVLPKLFGLFADRYAVRPRGYTRIHKFGTRFGDNAPMAILELVDNPQDIKLEVTARAVGWELLKTRLHGGDVSEILKKGVYGAKELIVKELSLDEKEVGQLRPATRLNLQKVLRFRSPSMIGVIANKAEEHVGLLLAKPVLMRGLLDELEANAKKAKDTRLSLHDFEKKRASFYRDQCRAGQVPPGETKGALRLSLGALGPPERRGRVSEDSNSSRYTFGNIYGKRP